MLERFLVAHGSEPSASLAEFSLGRLYLDALGDPARASGHFARALDHGLPVALTEDAIARLTEASARAGNVPAACAAAASYRARYPNGRHVATVDRWCNSAPR
jgi:transmembrane sensor